MTNDPLDDDVLDDDLAEELEASDEDDGDSEAPNPSRHWPPETPTWLSTGAANRTGARIADAISGALAGLFLNLLLAVSRLVPGSMKMYRALLRAGYKGMYKSSKKVDSIGHIAVGGQIKHIPLQFDHEKGRYKTLADDPEWWATQAEADNEYRVAGSVPTVWASARSNELGSHVQAEVAEALDLGHTTDLYRDATVRHVQVDGSQVNGAGQAMADGGQGYRSQITVEDPGQLADQLVDLSHDGAARVVSMEKYYETYPASADPEKMSQERLIGRLMERDQDLEKYAMKMLLIAGAIIVGSLAAVFVLPKLLGGGGGGGGGSILPIVSGAYDLALAGIGG